MLKGFSKGGIHTPEYKISKAEAIADFRCRKSLSCRCRNISAPRRRPASKGDAVRVGQVIGTAAGFVSSNIHAPVSGTVVAVDATPDTGGIRRPSISIRAEGDVWIDTIDCSDRLVKTCDLSKEEIFKNHRSRSGRHGGATFPTHIGLAVPAGQKC